MRIVSGNDVMAKHLLLAQVGRHNVHDAVFLASRDSLPIGDRRRGMSLGSNCGACPMENMLRRLPVR